MAALEVPDDRSARRFGVAAVWAATFAWAWAYILVKWSTLDGLRFAMFRLWAGVAVSCIAIVLARRRPSWEAFRACALGGVVLAADIALGFTAIKHTTIADVALIAALAPVAIVIVSARRLHERVTRRDWILVAVSFAGVIVVVVASSGLPSWSPFGDLLAACSIVTWSVYWFFSRSVRDRVDPIVYLGCVMLAAAIVITPAALLTSGVPTWPSARDWIAIWSVAVVPGFIGQTLVIWSHRHVESWRSALITQTLPVMAVVLAWVVLGEPITLPVVVGGTIVVAATGAVLVSAARRDPRSEEDAAVDVENGQKIGATGGDAEA
jgi:drug/metabolite transporter (DMT)-like permease